MLNKMLLVNHIQPLGGVGCLLMYSKAELELAEIPYTGCWHIGLISPETFGYFWEEYKSLSCFPERVTFVTIL